MDPPEKIRKSVLYYLDVFNKHTVFDRIKQKLDRPRMETVNFFRFLLTACNVNR